MGACTFRYWLTRELTPLSVQGIERRELLFCMLNPSVATQTVPDRTVDRCVDFGRRWGFDCLAVVNLFAAVSTDKGALVTFDDPVGPDNDVTIKKYARGATQIIAAWGDVPRALSQDRAEQVLEMLTSFNDVYRLGKQLTERGYPRHPARLAKNTPRLLHRRCTRPGRPPERTESG